MVDLFLRNDERSVSCNKKRGIRVTAIMAGVTTNSVKTDLSNV